jgi:hypothetical protein
MAIIEPAGPMVATKRFTRSDAAREQQTGTHSEHIRSFYKAKGTLDRTTQQAIVAKNARQEHRALLLFKRRTEEETWEAEAGQLAVCYTNETNFSEQGTVAEVTGRVGLEQADTNLSFACFSFAPETDAELSEVAGCHRPAKASNTSPGSVPTRTEKRKPTTAHVEENATAFDFTNIPVNSPGMWSWDEMSDETTAPVRNDVAATDDTTENSGDHQPIEDNVSCPTEKTASKTDNIEARKEWNSEFYQRAFKVIRHLLPCRACDTFTLTGDGVSKASYRLRCSSCTRTLSPAIFGEIFEANFGLLLEVDESFFNSFSRTAPPPYDPKGPPKGTRSTVPRSLKGKEPLDMDTESPSSSEPLAAQQDPTARSAAMKQRLEAFSNYVFETTFAWKLLPGIGLVTESQKAFFAHLHSLEAMKDEAQLATALSTLKQVLKVHDHSLRAMSKLFENERTLRTTAEAALKHKVQSGVVLSHPSPPTCPPPSRSTPGAMPTPGGTKPVTQGTGKSGGSPPPEGPQGGKNTVIRGETSSVHQGKQPPLSQKVSGKHPETSTSSPVAPPQGATPKAMLNPNSVPKVSEPHTSSPPGQAPGVEASVSGAKAPMSGEEALRPNAWLTGKLVFQTNLPSEHWAVFRGGHWVVIELPKGQRPAGEGAIPLPKGSSPADPPKKLANFQREALKWSNENFDRFWNHSDKKAHQNELTFIYVRNIRRDKFATIKAGFHLGGKLDASWFKNFCWLPDGTLECLVYEEKANVIIDFLRKWGKPATFDYATWEPELSQSKRFLEARKNKLTKRLSTLSEQSKGVRYHLKKLLETISKSLMGRVVQATRSN